MANCWNVWKEWVSESLNARPSDHKNEDCLTSDRPTIRQSGIFWLLLLFKFFIKIFHYNYITIVCKLKFIVTQQVKVRSRYIIRAGLKLIGLLRHFAWDRLNCSLRYFGFGWYRREWEIINSRPIHTTQSQKYTDHATLFQDSELSYISQES
jgi:hypothetical protein